MMVPAACGAGAALALVLCFGGSASNQPAARTTAIRIVALGDSTTAGTPGWRSPLEAPPAGAGNEQSQYAYWLVRAHPQWTVLNRGVNGERSDEIARRFERDVIAERPQAVVVIAGVNDVYQGHPAESVQRNLRQIYDRAQRAQIRVVAGTIVPYNTATAAQNRTMAAINDWIREQARVDPSIGVADTRQAAAAPDDENRLSSSPDGLHPSVDGYHRMADAIGAALERALR